MGTVSISLPSDGTAADVADVNTPLTAIVNAINGNLDANNLANSAVSTAKIQDASVTNAKLATTTGELGGAWNTWTPSWTNFTTGNGTLNRARYYKSGKFVYCQLKFTLGSTSNATGTIIASSPVTSVAYGSVFQDIGGGIFWDNSGTTLYNLKVVWESTTTVAFMVTSTGASYGTLNYLNNTTPVAITSAAPATSDYIQAWFVVEVA